MTDRARRHDAAMTGKPFEAKYTPRQRDAVAAAIVDARMTGKAACAAAAAGELGGLAAFEVKQHTALDWARKLRAARVRQERENVAARDPRGIIERLRLDLLDEISAALRAEKAKPAKHKNPERLRQIGRALREAQQVAGPTEPTPPRPGHAKDAKGRKHEGETRGGIAGPLLAAARGTVATHENKPAPTDDYSGSDATRDARSGADTDARDDTTTNHDDGTPAGLVRAAFAVELADAGLPDHV